MNPEELKALEVQNVIDARGTACPARCWRQNGV